MREVAAVLGFGVVVLTGCAATNPAASPSPSATTEPSPTQVHSPDTSPGAIPEGQRIRVLSHCGVVSVTVSGHLWLADPPLGDHNPPPGWDENETPGMFVIVSPGRAEFYGDSGQRATFRRATKDEQDPNAGCE